MARAATSTRLLVMPTPGEDEPLPRHLGGLGVPAPDLQHVGQVHVTAQGGDGRVQPHGQSQSGSGEHFRPSSVASW